MYVSHFRARTFAVSAGSSPDGTFAVSARFSPDGSFAATIVDFSPDRGGVRPIITGIGSHRMRITGMRVTPIPVMATGGMGVIPIPVMATTGMGVIPMPAMATEEY